MTSFRALTARQTDPKNYDVALETLSDADLPAGEVLLDVAYSSLNYKDALAITRKGRIVRRFPMVLGIDIAGTVVESSSDLYRPGDQVIGNGQGLGEMEWGGLSERQRVRADAIVPLPDGLSLEEAMRIGTAGFTAMLCVLALDRAGVTAGELVVTGAAGGVGSIAILLLSARGYDVVASTGRPELEEYLRSLGASSIVQRDQFTAPGGPLQTERWAGGVDTVGGPTLANLYAQTRYGGAIACCGMAGGHELNTTVWPLILRNVSLLGVSSLATPRAPRIEAWSAVAREADSARLASLSRTEPLSRVLEVADELMRGEVRGRVVIDVRS